MTPPDDLPRTDLGPYRLERLLGRGGMGAVYQAVDERLGRRVAIKHLPASLSGDERRRRRFRRESSALARLSHPAIVQIFDLVEAEGGDWIVMELVPGSTLAERVCECPLPWRQVFDVGRQIAEGLAEAHEQGVLHRDLKSENIMLQVSGPSLRAKILDFGLAKLSGQGTESALSQSGQILGTYGTMSPEQARGEVLDARSDLFSFGVVLYEMSAGQRPFRGSSGLEILQQVVGHRHEPLTERRPEAPQRLVDLIDRLLEKSPEHRPESARAVATALAAIAAEPERRESAFRADSRATLDPTISHEGSLGAGLERTEPTAARRLFRRLSRRRQILLATILAVLVMAVLALEVRRRTIEPDPSPPVTESRTEGSAAEASDPYTLFQRGMADLERFDKPDRIARAIAAFEAVLAGDERSAPAHAGLALAYWAQYVNDRDPLYLEQAQAVAERAVRLDEHLALARIALGTAYAEAGRTQDALNELEAAALLAPNNADVERGRGVAYRDAGEISAAVDSFERAVQLDPTDRFLRDELGTLYYRQGRFDQAEEQFLKSVESAPDAIYGYRNLSAVYYMQGRLPEASEALQKALEIQADPSLYSNLGTIFFAQGLYRPAVTAFEKALEGGANSPLYWANLADAHRMVEGSEPQAREAYQEAILLLRPKLASQPESPTLQSQLALYLAKSGECSEASTVLASAEFGDDAAAHYRSAVAQEVCGEREAALSALSLALVAGFSSDEVARDPELFALRSAPGYRRLLSSD